MIIFRKEYYGSFALFAGLLVGAYIAPHYEIPRISIEWKPPKEPEAETAGSNVSTTLEASPSHLILPALGESSAAAPQQSLTGDNFLPPPPPPSSSNLSAAKISFPNAAPSIQKPEAEAELAGSNVSTTLEASPSPSIPASSELKTRCDPPCVNGTCNEELGEEVLSPRIYVYELPPDFTVFSRRLGVLDDLAGVAFGFAERMFRSAHRTLDPNAADWFFAPGVGNCKSMNALSEYVRTTWPDLFGLTGARHVWPSIGQDFGFSNGANNKFGPCYVKDNKILPHLADSVFMDFRGPSKACFNLFRPGQDVRLPPLIVIGRTSQQIMPQDAVFSPRMHQFLKSSKATWQKRLSQTAGQIANNPMFLFAGKSAPLCWDKKEDGISKRCFNGGNSRGLLQNLFNTPFYSYPQGQK
eukprot:gene7028-8383_t